MKKIILFLPLLFLLFVASAKGAYAAGSLTASYSGGSFFTFSDFSSPTPSDLRDTCGVDGYSYVTGGPGGVFGGNFHVCDTTSGTLASDVYLPDGDYSVVWIASNGNDAWQSSLFTVTGYPTPSPTPTPTPSPNQLTSITPAQVWVGLKNSDDVGVKFDLLAEAYKDSNLVTSGEVDSVGGGAGFNNAHQDTINFNSFSPIDFPSGSQLSMKLYVRNACTGFGHNSGTARLWYNDSAANSQFGATIASSSSTYYLLDNFLLGTTTGSVKKTIDVQSGAKCSAFKPFGIWTITP